MLIIFKMTSTTPTPPTTQPLFLRCYYTALSLLLILQFLLPFPKLELFCTHTLTHTHTYTLSSGPRGDIYHTVEYDI